MTWQQADAFEWSASATYDLVSAQFMHLPRPAVIRLHRELAASVAPGGTLLIVGHHPDDVGHAPEGRPSTRSASPPTKSPRPSTRLSG